jgi:hypothetical protein
MNAKQRRRLVRQYKEKIHLDMAIIRLEGGKGRWFDPKHPKNSLINCDTVPWRYYMYALYMKDQEST